jgi:hypothetical protein
MVDTDSTQTLTSKTLTAPTITTPTMTTPVISSGAINLQSGQIAFPAVQAASADANTLDDYEEGSFTPTVASSGGGTPTYSVQVGRYVKIGKEVKFSLWVVLASKGTLVAGGGTTIGGLPFAAANIANLYHSCVVGQYQGATTAYVSVYAYVTFNSSSITLTFRAAASASAAVLLVSDIGATSDFMISGSYITDN